MKRLPPRNNTRVVYGEDHRVSRADQFPEEAYQVDTIETTRAGDPIRPAGEEVCLRR